MTNAEDLAVCLTWARGRLVEVLALPPVKVCNPANPDVFTVFDHQDEIRLLRDVIADMEADDAQPS